MYLKHDIMEDVVRECFSLSTLMPEVVSELSNNLWHRLLSSSSKGGLIFLKEGVQVDVF